MRQSQQDQDVAQAILGYLAEHPEAMDTPEGIAEWWLMRERVRVSVPTIMRVLHHLTESGLLDELGTGDTVRYRLRR
jgi:Fe2+ or Zn2+ uptake regulation protein